MGIGLQYAYNKYCKDVEPGPGWITLAQSANDMAMKTINEQAASPAGKVTKQ
jgi:hypothetical protein